MTNLSELVKQKKIKKIKDNFIPKKGVDYLTPEEIEATKKHFIENVIGEITPRKGVHYFDGRNGKDGRDGRDGVDADEKKIIKKVMAGIRQPKDGKDGNHGSPDSPRIILEKLLSLGDKELGILFERRSLKHLEDRLLSLETRRRPSMGGHGGTLGVITTTTGDNTTFTLSRPTQLCEMWVVRGSGLVHYENGDFTYTLDGGGAGTGSANDKVKTITLITPLLVAQGETLLIRGK